MDTVQMCEHLHVGQGKTLLFFSLTWGWGGAALFP